MKVSFTRLSLLFTLLISAPVLHAQICDLDLGPDVMVCNNATFTLNPNPVIQGDYAWSGSTGLSCYDCASPVVSGLTTGVYTYIATVTTPDCTASDTLRITVINGQSPQYAIADDQGICAGDSIALGGPAVAGTFYNWFSVPPGFSSALANPKVKPAATVTYYLSASNASCPLTVLDSVRITPVNLTLQISLNDTVKICRGASRVITATVNPAGETVTWSPSTGLQVGPNGATVAATPLESTLYTATASLGGCTRQRQVYFAVDSLPSNLDIQPADTTICQGEKVILVSPVYEPADFPNITFRWTPLTGTLTPDSLYNMAVQPNQTTPYRRITRNRNGVCVDTATTIVRVIPTAQMTVSPADTLICPGESVQFNLTYTPGVTDIKWEPAQGLSCSSCDNPIATPTASTNYTISGSFQGCPVSQSARIDLIPLAPLQFPSDVQLCLGESVTLNQAFDPLAKYTWTSTHPGFGTVSSPNPDFTPTQTATYYVTADNGCIRTDSVRIFVLSATLSADGDTTICKNFTAPLSASSNVNGSYQWRNNLTGLIVGNMQSVTVKPDVTTTYTVIFTYGDNCQATRDVTVTIDGEAPTLVFPTDTKICPGETVKLNSGPVLPGTVYAWTASPPDPGLLASAPNPEVSPSQNTVYTVTATLDKCSVTRQLDITAFRATLAVTADTSICAQTSVTLRATGSDANGVYKWNTGETTPVITKNPSVATTYSVVYTYGDNCTLTDSVRVSVVPNFSLDLQCVPDTNEVAVGTLLTLTAVVTPPQNLSNFTFVWQETTVDTKLLPFNSESVDVVPSSNDTTAASVRYTLTATSPNGCVQVVEKIIRLIFPIVRFPNAFTPDGDGNNDTFTMVVPQGLAYIDLMEIYNRWGQKVFESTDPNAAWDGTVDGQDAPSDVYLYRVWWRRGDDALQVQSKGDVTLLR